MHEDATIETRQGLQPGDLWHGLTIENWLGSGAFGGVYRARDTKLDRDVALKLYHQDRLGPEREQALLREARLLAKVRHPNVVTIFGAETAAEGLGLWMEYIDGEDLAAVIRERGTYSAADTALAGTALCSALAAVHAMGILHRDLKPSNIMREDGGRLLLMDFGAGVVGSSAEAVLTTAGSPVWMAPEALRGRGATVRTDIYSLGAVLFALATGVAPIAGGSLEEIRKAHANGRRKRLRDVRPDLPAGFVAIIEKALSADPRERFATAGEFEAALAGFLTGVAGTAAPATSPHEDTTAPVRRSGRRLFMAAGFVLAAALVIGLGPWRNPGPATSLTADFDFVGVREGRSRNLVRGSTVGSRDLLALTARFNRPSHLYVLNVDRTGRVVVMYPMAGSGPPAALAPNIRHRLPTAPDGRTLGWVLDRTRGPEVFLLVASEQPLAEFEQELADLPTVDVGGGLRVRPADGTALAALSRGVAGVAPLDGESVAGIDALTRLMSMAEDGGSGKPDLPAGIWIERWHLENLGAGGS